MPKLFDVYMATQVTSICTHYVYDREHSLFKDSKLTSKKIAKVTDEMGFCRELLMSKKALGSLEAWQKHLKEFESTCRQTVTDYNEKHEVNYPEGKLVTDYIAEAQKLVEQVYGLFVLFGLDNADETHDSVELKGRYLLLEMCMAHLYRRNDMDPDAWMKMTAFREEMGEFRTVTKKNNKKECMDYVSLKRSVEVWLEKNEDLISSGKMTMAEKVTNSAVHTASYLVEQTRKSVVGLVTYAFGAASSSSASSSSTEVVVPSKESVKDKQINI